MFRVRSEHCLGEGAKRLAKRLVLIRGEVFVHTSGLGRAAAGQPGRSQETRCPLGELKTAKGLSAILRDEPATPPQGLGGNWSGVSPSYCGSRYK
jgi:hypothetical protein